MKNQTALDWLIQQMIENYHLTDQAYKDFEKAKLWIKEQITQAYDDGAADQSVWEYTGCIDFDKTGEQYYTEKYQGDNP